MSEKKETVVKKAPAKPAPPKKQRDGSSGAFLAMLIALGAAGGSYYIWQQHLVAEQDRQVLEVSIESLLKVVEQKDQAQLTRIEQLRQHQHDEVEQRIATLEQNIPELNQQLTIQQQQWTLAEVDYLLRTAEHRLQLNRDIPTAITALSQARDQLRSRTSGNFSGLIAAIDMQITQLAQLDQDVLGRIANQLGGLIAAIETLPVVLEAGGEELSYEAPTPPAEDAELVDKAKHWGRMVWHDLKSLVTVRHGEEIALPLVDSQQHYLLQAQLRIKLETARLAAMGHNQPLYAATLSEAGALLELYFDTADTGVSGAKATLEQLAALQVDAPLPALVELRHQLSTSQQQSYTAPPQPEPAPVEPFDAPFVEPNVAPNIAPEQLYNAPAQPEFVPAQPFWGNQP